MNEIKKKLSVKTGAGKETESFLFDKTWDRETIR